ncbi:MAG: HEAT repeat domain-containing protein [Xanthomonadales bacterium]|nr:HEAT repeat domain-containing protein [Xanthomonadales bacterium]
MANRLDKILASADALDQALADQSPVIEGFHAVKELRKLAGKVPALEECAVTDFLAQCTGPGRRMLALEWMGSEPPAEALDFLGRCLNTGPYLAQLRAASALAAMGGNQARSTLEAAQRRATDRDTRKTIDEALAQFSYPIIPARVRKGFADPSGRFTAVEALGKITSYDATDLLLEALQDKDRRTADLAFKALAERPDDRIAPALITLLTEGRAPAKKLAAKLLGYRREKLALRALCETCRTASARDLRMTAAFALGKIGNTEAIPVLEQCLFDPEEDILVTTAACISLGKIADPGILAKLQRVVSEHNHGRGWADLPVQRDIYCAAIDGISRLALPEVPGLLVEMLNTPHEYERAEAAKCLGRLKHVAALPALERASAAPARYSDSRDAIDKAIKRLQKIA